MEEAFIFFEKVAVMLAAGATPLAFAPGEVLMTLGALTLGGGVGPGPGAGPGGAEQMANTFQVTGSLCVPRSSTRAYQRLAMSPLTVLAASFVSASGPLACTTTLLGGPTWSGEPWTTPPPSARLLDGHFAYSSLATFPERLKGVASIVASEVAEQIANTFKFRGSLEWFATAAYQRLAMSPLTVLAASFVSASGPLAATAPARRPLWTTPPPSARCWPGHTAYSSPILLGSTENGVASMVASVPDAATTMPPPSATPMATTAIATTIAKSINVIGS